MNSIGELISQKRKENRITQKQLADLLHLTPSAISKWENDVAVPHISQFPQIAEVLQIPVAELYALTIGDFRYVNIDEESSSTESSEINEWDCRKTNPSDSYDNEVVTVKKALPNRISRKLTTILLLTLALSLIAIFTIFSPARGANSEPIVTIVDEYFCDDEPYFDHTDIYYVIIEYDGTLTEEFLQSYEPLMREKYSDKFTEASIILIYFYDNYSGFESNIPPEMKLVLLPSAKR